MKTPNFSHDFFDTWTEHSAYVLGFWYADGSIGVNSYAHNGHNYAYKQFSVCNTDKQIIDDLTPIIGITPKVVKPRKKNEKTSYQMQVNSDKLFDFCYSLVGTIDKTHSTSFPTIVPNHLLHHFIRGFFDGDGSILIKRYKTRHGKVVRNLTSSFTASKESWIMLEDLKNLLKLKLNTGNRKIVIWRDKKTGFHNSKLCYAQYDTMLLCEWMYQDATIFMKRKKAVWDAFDKKKLKDSVKYFSNKV